VEIDVSVAAPGSGSADVLAVCVLDPIPPLPTEAARIDERIGGGLGRLAESRELHGRREHVVLLHVDGQPADRIAAVGAGPADALDADAIRAAAGAVARTVRDFAGTIAWQLDASLPLPLLEQARAAVDGVVLGAYDPGLWKRKEESERALARLVLWTDEPETLSEAARRAALIAAWTNRSRDLSNTPPNELTPEALAARAEEMAGASEHVTFEALGPEEIRALGMGAFAAVSQGAHNPPRLIVLRYDPPNPSRSDLVLGLVGKAVTFDTGGISIKPALNMENMKGDMSGGAAVIASVGAIAELELPLRTLAVVGATENAVGGGAYRPGDILTAMNGRTIEVINTDAEGRLVLADALWYTREQGATHLLDLATLTGAMELALGDLYAGCFGNDSGWRDQVIASGEAVGDHVWPFPLHPRYRRYIDSHFADMKNSSVLRQGSPVLAAEFLQEFVGDGPWAHVDLAGPAFLTYPRPDYLTQRGGTGYGVRLVAELARRLCEPSR